MCMLACQLEESRASKCIPHPPHHMCLDRNCLPSLQTGLTTFRKPSITADFSCWPACTQEAPHSCGASHEALLTLGKISTAEEHQGKPCPATGNVPTQQCTPASLAHPQEMCLYSSAHQPVWPTHRKCAYTAVNTSQSGPPTGNVPTQQ